MKLGTILCNRYKIVRPIAQGGMANIFEGRDGGQRVVVKVLKEGLSTDPEIVARFQRESRAASSLKSKHVVRILGFGTTDEDRPFLVMEYLFGNDLAKELEKRRVIPLEEAATYMTEACQAMIEAHAAGVVHRDLKPTNLYLARDAGKRVLKVLDFGIAKVTGNASEEQITRPSSLMGSPLYMSPETFKGAQNADARSDVWSLGVIFYEMITGVPPFQAEGAAAVGMAVMRDEPVAATTRKSQLPGSVDALIARALKKDPAERFQTMQELLAAFEVYVLRGRHDTMTIPQVVAPRHRMDPPAERKDDGATELMKVAAPAVAAIAPGAPDAAPVDHDEPLEAPTRIRTTSAIDEPPTIVVGPADDDPATLARQSAVELGADEFTIEESTGGDVAVPTARAEEARDERAPEPRAPHGPPVADRPSPFGASDTAESEAFRLPKKKLPMVAWLVPSVALAAGFIGWLMGRAGAPDAASGAPQATASAAPSTEHRPRPTATLAATSTADATVAAATASPDVSASADASAVAEASASASVEAEPTESIAALDIDTPPAGSVTAPKNPVGARWRKPPKPPTTGKKKPFTPTKI